jgi:hypothetical protein
MIILNYTTVVVIGHFDTCTCIYISNKQTNPWNINLSQLAMLYQLLFYLAMSKIALLSDVFSMFILSNYSIERYIYKHSMCELSFINWFTFLIMSTKQYHF